ncbi:aminotransferase class I/II-fold pyridoxal phosphate-dependent enzyme [Nocardia veterana]|uniref:Aminotransferase class I/II-fold pyridoxal phosphate-dependent enzyme n=1 Tax=Nocardia veterana TaxID=132249 RepID=A0A7X6RH54_9NOCA|nr:aminotransferase class I/II-fold pyridoxal phosphate-dependent enzyme [Nocardia veterana]NKY85746.1 aminotransferase class I/II-fold pyridoxal phosphate-dependent enzyme [Nocardia veterana]
MTFPSHDPLAVRAVPPVRFDLTLSENPFPPLPSVLAVVQEAMRGGNRYPEFLPRRLPALIADHLGVDAEQVVVGTGATGVVLQIMQTVAGPGRRMVFATPTFDGYPIMAAMAGLESVAVPLDSSGRQRLPAMARAVDERTALVAVCRPHNPTGTVPLVAELRAFLFGIPRHIPVILDEAYVEFLADGERADTADLLAHYPNLLVLRTFSKAYGLAGLRIGYAFGAPELVGRIRRLQLPFGTPDYAVAAVRACYAASAELAARIADITAARERLRTALRHRGIAVPRSRGNFLYLPNCEAHSTLAKAGIAAKGYPDGRARIAVGDPRADAAVLDAFDGRIGAASGSGRIRSHAGVGTATARWGCGPA